jgi:P4 family phage/plasmid primase-like protien
MDTNSSNNKNINPSNDHKESTSSPSENLQSTLLHTLKNLLSPDDEMPPPTSTGKDPASTSTHSNGINSPASQEERFKSRSRERLVIIPGIELDRTLNTHAVEHITGGELLTPSARTTHLSSPQYPLHHFKLWIATNHLPTVRDHSVGAWRRIKLIPFPVSFLGCEDRHLATKLQASASAILNWAIQGCLTWQRHGLLEPHCVERANAGYQDQEDELRSFLLDCSEFGPDKQVKAKELYQAYHQWCQFNEQTVLSNQLFGRLILAHGYLRVRKKTGKIYLGIGLAPFTPLS